MARPTRKLHELVLVRRSDKAYVWFGGKYVYLGKWDGEEPSEIALRRFEEYKAKWKVNPTTEVKVKSDALFCELWKAWKKSPEAPLSKSRKDFERTERLLFGTMDAIGPHLGTKLTDFTALELRTWQSHLCQLKDKNGKLCLSRDTIRRCVNLVRQGFQWGAVGGVVDQNHAASLLFVESPAKGKVKEGRKLASVNKTNSEKAIPFLSPPLQKVVQLLWLTTARPSEILGLMGEDLENLSEQNQFHRIQRTGSILLRGGADMDLEQEGVWAAVLEEHKTAGKGFERVIFFGPKAQEILRPIVGVEGYLFKPREGREFQLAEQAKKQTTTGKGSKKPKKGELAERKPGEFYSSDALCKAVKKACKKAKIPPYSPYQIRHTASAAIMYSHGKEAASVYMGHKPSGMTGNYTGNNLRLAAKVAKEVG